MTEILAMRELGLAFGHVAMLAGLARGFGRRGDRTTLATRDLVAAAAVPDRPFARTLQAPVHERGAPRRPTLTYADVIADGGMADPDHATVLVAAWLQLFDLVRPDAVVAGFAPASLLAAHVAGLRRARFGMAWIVPPVPLPPLMPWLPDDPAARAAGVASADAVVRTVCRRFGAPMLDGLEELLAASPRCLATWPESDHNGVAPGETYYGPLSDLGARARPDWPEGTGPRLFVYLPGNHAAAPALVAALSDLGWPTIWAAAAAPPGLPANVAHRPGLIDTRAVLGEADLLAGRGGHATGCEALQRGVPQLILPDTLEVTLLGWRLQRRGLALMTDAAPAADTLRGALERLADGPYRAAARTAAARYADYDPVAAEDRLVRDIRAGWGLA